MVDSHPEGAGSADDAEISTQEPLLDAAPGMTLQAGVIVGGPHA
jgi:hypothetical protein